MSALSVLINFFSIMWSIIRIPVIMVVKAGIPIVFVMKFIKRIFLMIDKIINALAEVINDSIAWLEEAADDLANTFDFF